MNTILRSKEYRVKNINISLILWDVQTPQSRTYHLVEQFNSSKGDNSILRGIYNDKGVGEIEFKNLAYKLETVLPNHQVSFA